MVPIHEPRELTAWRCQPLCDFARCCSRVMLLTHASIPAMIGLVVPNECLLIARLQILSSWRLDIDHRIVKAARRVSWAKSTVQR